MINESHPPTDSNCTESVINIIGEDDYEYNIDEIETITIRNKFGLNMTFKPEEIKKIEIVKSLSSNKPSNE